MIQARDAAPLVECLPSMHDTLSLVLAPQRHRHGDTCLVIPAPGKERQDVLSDFSYLVSLRPPLVMRNLVSKRSGDNTL